MRPSRETIILEPTCQTTHFSFETAPPRLASLIERGRGDPGEAAEAVAVRPPEPSRPARVDGGVCDKIRLDRFQHVPGSLVCFESLEHVKVPSGGLMRCRPRVGEALEPERALPTDGRSTSFRIRP